ncbi:glutamine-hydrolyzing GMP synthase subunit GuaA, partial [Halobacteriales archaeon QH_7_66_37]
MVDVDSFVAEKITEIGDAIGDANAVIALSGGVDSSTAAALAYEAVGDQLTPVYVDTGLMRKGETGQVRETFAYMDSLRIVDARERFLDELSGVTDPEEKRHVIGEQFIREFETAAREVDADYLVQGTIYPDRIESEGTIKSHHNVGGLPERIDFEEIVEPMRDLYKDEVREVARELDLDMSERMPFPGPGLAVRILGEVTEEKLAVA